MESSINFDCKDFQEFCKVNNLSMQDAIYILDKRIEELKKE